MFLWWYHVSEDLAMWLHDLGDRLVGDLGQQLKTVVRLYASVCVCVCECTCMYMYMYIVCRKQGLCTCMYVLKFRKPKLQCTY